MQAHYNPLLAVRESIIWMNTGVRFKATRNEATSNTETWVEKLKWILGKQNRVVQKGLIWLSTEARGRLLLNMCSKFHNTISSSHFHSVTWRIMPKVCSQKSISETTVAGQRLAETRFHGKDYAYINQCVTRRLSHLSWKQRIPVDDQSSVLLSDTRSAWS
jgi:hypothetical protein